MFFLLGREGMFRDRVVEGGWKEGSCLALPSYFFIMCLICVTRSFLYLIKFFVCILLHGPSEDQVLVFFRLGHNKIKEKQTNSEQQEFYQ